MTVKLDKEAKEPDIHALAIHAFYGTVDKLPVRPIFIHYFSLIFSECILHRYIIHTLQLTFLKLVSGAGDLWTVRK